MTSQGIILKDMIEAPPRWVGTPYELNDRRDMQRLKNVTSHEQTVGCIVNDLPTR